MKTKITVAPYSKLQNDDSTKSTLFYYLRSSSNKSKEPDKNIKKQKKVFRKLITDFGLPKMNNTSFVVDYKNGATNLVDREFAKIPENTKIVSANFDRISKEDSLVDIIAYRNNVVGKGQIIFIPDKEYELYKKISRGIKTGKRLVKIVTAFLSTRLVETIGSHSYRKPIESISKDLIVKIKKDLQTVKDCDLAIWIAASNIGACINEYLTMMEPIDEARISNFDIAPYNAVATIDHNHPEYLESRKKNQLVIAEAKKKGVELTSSRISKIRNSIVYSMIMRYKRGLLGNHLINQFDSLKIKKDKTSFTGLSKQDRDLVQKYFPRYKGLRPFQIESINMLQSGENFVLQVMAGGGKSFIYQYAALTGRNVLVISPFRPLIINQVRQAQKVLRKANIGFLSSDNSDKRNHQNVLNYTIDNFGSHRPSLLFSTPDQLNVENDKKLKEYVSLLASKVDLLVFDEAHHIPIDGEYFREVYGWERLNDLWSFLGMPQTVFMSATLSQKSLETLGRINQYVKNTTHSNSLPISQGPLRRSNVLLQMKIFDEDKKLAQPMKTTWICLMVKFMKEVLGFKKIIVYVNSPARVYQMMRQLKVFFPGKSKIYGMHSKSYTKTKDKGNTKYKFIKDKHGGCVILSKSGCSDKKIESVQDEFEKGKGGIMVSTSAYSEGIDVAVEGVIVADLPVTIETLYQMVSRAGHQGQKAISFICIDQKSINFNIRGLLKEDQERQRQFNENFKFLEDSTAVWDDLVDKIS